eukprot:2054031-Rhodomonas_salina.2
MLGKDERDAECVIVRRFLEQTRLWVSSWLDGSPTVDPGWPKNASVRGALALAFPVRPSVQPRPVVISTTVLITDTSVPGYPGPGARGRK